MPHSGITDVNKRAIVCFERNSNVLLQDTIRTGKQPIATIGQDLAAQAGTLERTAYRGKEAARAA